MRLNGCESFPTGMAEKMTEVVNRGLPEHEILLWCARSCTDSERRREITSLLQEGIDWDDLLRRSLQHGMAPLLYWRLRDVPSSLVPSEIQTYLADFFRYITTRTLRFCGKAIRLQALLRSDNIPSIVYKGPVLAGTLYENLGLRPFVDLDLLVPESSIGKARELLLANGYRLGGRSLTSLQDAAWIRTEKDYPLIGNDDQLTVELHWRFSRKSFHFPLEAEPIWQRLRTIPLAGRTIQTLSSEDSFLFLCTHHGGKHGFERLIWLYDIARTIELEDGLDWDQGVETARKLGVSRSLFLSLYLCRKILRTPIPEQLWPGIQDDTEIEPLSAQVQKRLTRPQFWASPWEKHFFKISVRERLRDKVHYFCQPRATEWNRVPLPLSLFFLYYLFRPIRMVVKYARWRMRAGANPNVEFDTSNLE